MNTILKCLLGLVALSVSLSSCFENPSYTYEGPAVVELKNPRAGFATQPTNNVSNGVRARTVRQSIARDSILVQLVGPLRPVATDLQYTIDAASTAVDGTHYQVVGTKGTVSIPANASSTYVVFRILPGIPTTAPATQIVTLVLNLVGSTDVKPSENYKTFTFTIRN
ncbi:MAG: hypothetical protein H7Y12_11135 [Sphingobacteriaceae bacterium]|nr:hypothetical protein [Cytophagaceae bacterium]